MNLFGFVLVAFVAWHIYRAVRALRTGTFDSLGGPVDRTSAPDVFWWRVAREFAQSALFAALWLSLMFESSRATSAWLFGGYVVVYVAISVMTLGRRAK